MQRIRFYIVFSLVFALLPQQTFAWNEHGHRVIASIAFQLLPSDVRLSIASKIRKHPRWQQDFESKMPEVVKNGDQQTQAEWIFQQACVWPDVARGFRGEDRKYHHGNWHWADKVLYLNGGDKEALGELKLNQSITAPAEATDEMNAIQTIVFSRLRIRGSIDASDEEIALFYCWLLHSYADIHQPCHSTALFSQKLFPEGDRGANLIKTKQSGNMHALWDGLLGNDNGFEACRNRAENRIKNAKSGADQNVYTFKTDV